MYKFLECQIGPLLGVKIPTNVLFIISINNTECELMYKSYQFMVKWDIYGYNIHVQMRSTTF